MYEIKPFHDITLDIIFNRLFKDGAYLGHYRQCLFTGRWISVKADETRYVFGDPVAAKEWLKN